MKHRKDIALTLVMGAAVLLGFSIYSLAIRNNGIVKYVIVDVDDSGQSVGEPRPAPENVRTYRMMFAGACSGALGVVLIVCALVLLRKPGNKEGGAAGGGEREEPTP